MTHRVGPIDFHLVPSPTEAGVHTTDPFFFFFFLVRVHLAADSQSTNSSAYRASLWDPWPDFILLFFFRLTITLFFLRRPLWRENGPVVYSAIIRLIWDCSLFVASYDAQGLRWKYCNLPPHGADPFCSGCPSLVSYQLPGAAVLRPDFLDGRSVARKLPTGVKTVLLSQPLAHSLFGLVPCRTNTDSIFFRHSEFSTTN
jgi:hypothetical protein